jgi:hypothetical protein
MDAVARGVRVRPPEPGTRDFAFIDPAGGSNDAMTCGISYQDPEGRAVLARVLDQGQAPPFDPRAAVDRFAGVLREYRITRVVGDAYAGQTFAQDFLRHGIVYEVAGLTAASATSSSSRRSTAIGSFSSTTGLRSRAPRPGLARREDRPPPGNTMTTRTRRSRVPPRPGRRRPVDTTMTDDEAHAIRRISHPGELSIDADDVVGNFLDPAAGEPTDREEITR